MLPSNPVKRRYLLRMLFLNAIYLTTLYLALRYVDAARADIWMYVSALLPAIAIMGMFWAIIRFLVELEDEYQRLLHVRQTIIATGFALSFATIWGFLEQFGLVPFIPAWWVTVLWFFGVGIGAIINKLTIGDAGHIL